ncbi:MAG: hypothetical protein Rubg2KO_24630 [Rubricoccaceae bacterium]
MPVAAQTTFMVTTTSDDGVGSLRQAITDANANPGTDGIAFNIPGDGVQTIRPQSALPVITEALTVDGLTQPGAHCDTWPATLRIELDGSDRGEGSALEASAPGLTVRGLVIGGFDGFDEGVSFKPGATDGVVECSYLGTNAAGTAPNPNGNGVLAQAHRVRIGGPEPGQRNLISGNESHQVMVMSASAFSNDRTFDTVIQGNVIGPDVTGEATISAESARGIWAYQAERTQIGGADHTPWTCDRACNLIAGNGGGQVELNVNSNESVVEGNFLGTNQAGDTAFPAADFFFGGSGVAVAGSRVRVGGPAPGAGNLISGNPSSGVTLFGGGVGVVVQGNRIGVARDGVTPLGNEGYGVGITESREHTIGGTEAGSGNVIANNQLGGVVVGYKTFIVQAGNPIVQVPFENRILGNRIYGNAGMDIDLANDGPTGNDSLDVDSGPNRRMNRPDLDLSRITTGAGSVPVAGRIHAEPGETIRVEAFASPACDPERFGPGQVYAGAFSITTDAQGEAAFDQTLAAAGVPAGWTVTATATDADGNTSEFSQCLPFPDDVLTVRATASSGPGSLTEAVEAANAMAFSQTVSFDIPPGSAGCSGDGACRIRLEEPLVINGPVTIDGTTQAGASCGGGPATVKVELDGGDDTATGLRFIGISQGSAIRGLALGQFTGAAITIADYDPFYDPSGQHLIECNHLGTDASGTQAWPNAVGISVWTLRNQIGGPGRGNLISGNAGDGIVLTGGGSFGEYALVQGNRIGVAHDGTTPLPNGGSGVHLTNGARYVLVGGESEDEGNTIAHNAADGIRVSEVTNSTSSRPIHNQFFSNRTFSNGGLGINLCPPVPSNEACDAATPNDDEDWDRGPNDLQNHPEITEAGLAGPTARVVYRVPTSTRADPYPIRVDFYLADADGQEGMTYIGTDSYAETDYDDGPDKEATFTLTSDATPGQFIVATATGLFGTSEFSPTPVSLPGEGDPALPTEFALDAPWPNPVRQRATVRVALPEPSVLTVEVFDLLGRQVRQLVDADRPAGWHELALDADGLASGVYLVRMVAGEDFTAVRRITVVR